MPEKFNPKLEVAGGFIECGGEFILLHRQDHKAQGDTWGIPSGKIHDGENPRDAACRETAEETGVIISRDHMGYFATVYVRYPDYDFIYHIFHAKIKRKAEIEINRNEHKDAKWVSPQDALRMPLIGDLGTCIKLFFQNT
jgi:8-oxo-dGTP diphosphatase